MGFTDELWDGAMAETYGAILAHPFLTGLTDGTLDTAAFRHYVVQDALYLSDYARALAICAARAPDDEDVAMFARHAAGAIEVERELHTTLLGELGIDPQEAAATSPAPTTLAYTSYLLRVCHQGSFAEGLGAVLPCYWVYAEVGRELVERGSPDARYQRWIDTYAAPEFQDVVREVLAATDRVGQRLSAAERRVLCHHAEITTRYEWMFWDMGLRQEAWPV